MGRGKSKKVGEGQYSLGAGSIPWQEALNIKHALLVVAMSPGGVKFCGGQL